MTSRAIKIFINILCLTCKWTIAEKMNQDPGHCLLEILTARLRKSEPLTWNDIDAALREECVGLGRMYHRSHY